MGGKVDVIIQARMGSTRLPGKVLMQIRGRTLLSYLFERLRMCRNVSRIILATSVDAENDALERAAADEGVEVFRGSEDDVLDRYYQAAKLYRCEHIMRITADCPLVDPDLCDRIIDTYFRKGVDYIHTGLSFSEGLDCEIISRQALCQAWEGAVKLSEREHVAMFIHNNKNMFNTLTVENDSDDGHYRYSVDNMEDYLVVKAIFESLYFDEKNVRFNQADIKEYLDNNPNVFRMNSNIVRNEGLLKSLEADKCEKK